MKTILVDMDGVVYDWVGTFAEWLQENNVISSAGIAKQTFRRYEVWEDWDIPEGEFFHWWRKGIENGVIYGKGKTIKNARSSLWRLSDAGWNIHLCTKRLTKLGLHDQILLNTANWLKNNNIPYREISFVSNKHKIRADAAVDDNLEHLNPDNHGKCFLFPCNHNLNVEIKDGRIVKLPKVGAWEYLLNNCLRINDE